MSDETPSSKTSRRLWPSIVSGWSVPGGIAGIQAPPSPPFSVGQAAVTYDVEVTSAPLAANERGVIITNFRPEWFIPGGLQTGGFNGVDPAHLQTMLLFFDRVDLPSNGLVELASSYNGLAEAGIIERSHVVIGGDTEALRRFPFEVYKARNAIEPGLWSYGQSAQSLGLPADEMVAEAAFRLQLENALPIFERSVPLESVLDFRARRRDEMLALRQHLDELCLDVASNGYSDLATRTVFHRFDRALAEHCKTMRESNLTKVLAQIEVSMNWSQFVTAGVGFAAAMSAGLPLSGAMLSGLGAATAGVTFETTMGLRGADNRGPFRYLTSAEKKLF